PFNPVFGLFVQVNRLSHALFLEVAEKIKRLMELERLNKLITKISFIHQFLSSIRERDPLMEEALVDHVTTLNKTYSGYLSKQLKKVYRRFFTDDVDDSLVNYLIADGVVLPDPNSDFPVRKVSIKAFPLRIEVSDLQTARIQTLWSEA
ncbi:MAG: hypothetical protein AAGA66_15660, partial [Bacteroidota bacterium]